MATLLHVERLSKYFGGLAAIRNVTFTVSRGEILGIIGPNGAGKTTLFSLISGFLEPTGGEIFLNETRITGYPPSTLVRRGLGRTFQLVRPFPRLTVLENVLMGAFLRAPARAEAERRARHILEFVGLDALAARPATSLTQAALKRLEIAKVLATEPQLLLLDEVVAGLNPTETDAAIELIRQIHATGITIIIVEHVMRVIMGISQRLLVLDHGEVIAEGPPQAVATNPDVIAAYLGVPDATG